MLKMLKTTHDALVDAVNAEAFEIIKAEYQQDNYCHQVRLGHLWGDTYIDVERAVPVVGVRISCQDKPVGEWPIDRFNGQETAEKYACGALKNTLMRAAKDLIANGYEDRA